MPITRLRRTARFERDFKRLDQQLQGRVYVVLQRLMQDPIPGSLRHHTLNGHFPTVHVIDVTTNHSHQITFNLSGDEAILLRIGTHRQIDLNPE